MARTSALTQGSNLFQTTPEDINAHATDFFTDGVVGAITLNAGSGATGAGAISAQASPNMTVIVKGGTFYVTATPTGQASQRLRVKMDDNLAYSITSNSSGSTAYDYIYVKVDATLANNPDVNGSTVGSFVTSRSTSNTTDNGTPPTYGYCLGYITVGNGVVSITNANVTDKRVLAVNKVGRIAVSKQLAGTVPATSWAQFTITFPNSQAMSANDYAFVFTHAGEFSNGGQGAARLQPGVGYPINSTQASVWVYNNYTSALTAYVSYICMQTT